MHTNICVPDPTKILFCAVANSYYIVPVERGGVIVCTDLMHFVKNHDL